MNKLTYAVAVILALVLVAYVMSLRPSSQSAGEAHKNITVKIDQKDYRLVNGVSEVEAAPGSASKIVTKYFGNDAKGDINQDGIVDLAYLVTQETGGTGTFYYLVGALQQPNGSYVGTEGVLLGDRIAPQTTEIQGGIVVVNYADRAHGEPMTAQPSVGKTLRLKLSPATIQFGIVANDFEGEADPSRMKLDMKEWEWISALYNDGTNVAPKTAGQFKISFKDGQFSATTDCNSMSGSYTAGEGTLTFGAIAMTKKFCEGSQEADFAKLLENTSEFHFTPRGELVLGLKFDSGTATFR